MLPSWHNVSSGSNPQPPISASLTSPGSRVLWSPERTAEDKPQNWTRIQEAQPKQGYRNGPFCRWALGKLGGANCEFRTSLLMFGSSSETRKALEEDLNQRFLALRSPIVRSHCATNLMAQSHAGLTRGSAWSVEETINPIFLLLLLLLWALPAVTLSPSTLDPWAIQDQNHVANPSLPSR